MRIFGKVQNVGLRVQIKAIADNLGVCGTVENLPDGSVRVICKAESAIIDEMVRQIRYETQRAVIKDIKMEPSLPDTDWSCFVIVVQDLNRSLLATAQTATKTLLDMSITLNEMKQRQDVMIERQDVMIEKQDVMIEKQDQSNKTLDGIAKGQDEMKDMLKSIDNKLDAL